MGQGADEFELLWSSEISQPPGEDWEPREPKDYNELRFQIERGGELLAHRVVRQWVRPPGVRSESLGDGLVGELCLPANDHQRPFPGLVLLGGSGGGNSWARRMAGLLAQEGFASLALAYFNGEGLPSHLIQVPIEPVFKALDHLKLDPRVNSNRLVVCGYSKGAELALLVASKRSDVGAVVAFAPGSAVFQGFKPPRFPTLSSWSLNGQDVPFVPNAYDKKFFETYDGMYLWYRTLSQHEAMAEAAIEVEKIGGDILLLSGVEDRIWPATYMAEQIVARLHVKDFPHKVQHLAFPRAGHGIASPPGEPTTGLAERLGGSASGNAKARQQGWRVVQEFLRSSH